MSNLTLFPGISEVKYCRPTGFPAGYDIKPYRVTDNLLASVGLTVGFTLLARALFIEELPAGGAIAVFQVGASLLIKRFNFTPEGNYRLSDDSGSADFQPDRAAPVAVGLYACLHETGRLCQRVNLGHRERETPEASILGKIIKWEADESGNLKTVTQDWWDIYGGSPAEMMGAGFASAFYPADRLKVLTAWREAISAGRSFYGSYRIVTKFGPLPVVTFAYPVSNGDGRIVGWRGYTQLSQQARASNF